MIGGLRKLFEWYPRERKEKKKISIEMGHGNEESLRCVLSQSSGKQNRIEENEACLQKRISE